MVSIIEEIQAQHDIKTRASIFQMFENDDDISTSLIQRKCKTGYYTASRTFQNLIKGGFIKKGEGGNVSKFINNKF